MTSNRFKPIPMGSRFGMWTVKALGSNMVGRSCRWLCKCDCGTEREVDSTALRNGDSTCCGCVKPKRKEANRKTRTYRIWKAMKTRCTNPNFPDYPEYGGRGIVICERWIESYEAFLSDMGECPPGLSIDRRDNDGNYEPGNCRWATKIEQANNTRRHRRYTLNGKTLTLAQWVRETGIPYACLLYRHMNGWDDERALTTPSRAVARG